MVVSITPAAPGARAGPGLPITLSSNFVGPITTQAFYALSVLDSLGSTILTQINVPTFGLKTTSTFLWSDQSQTQPSTPVSWPQIDSQVQIRADLTDNSSVIDTGSRTGISWDPTSALGQQAFLLSKSTSSGGGFTETDRQILNQVGEATIVTQLVNNLTLQDVTHGPSAGPIEVTLGLAVFGVIIRIDQVPADFVPNTPDGDYFQQSLAVLRVFRGSDLWLRVPVHTSTKHISFWNTDLVTGVPGNVLAEWMLNMHMQVTFKPGVLGEVFLMGFP